RSSIPIQYRPMSVKQIFESMEYGPAPESADLAGEWIAKHEKRFGLFIDGQFSAPSDQRYFVTLNPSNAKPLAEIAQAGAEDVDRAVEAARLAQPAWFEIGGFERAKVLYAVARLVQRH